MSTTLVAGAGGFIGGHLVDRLLDQGHAVTAVDVKPWSEWYQVNPSRMARNYERLDLSDIKMCEKAVDDAKVVFNLAADMGGIGYIEENKAQCMLSVLINTHLLRASLDYGIEKYFYASSACVYAADKQTRPDLTALREEDAYPAMPEDGYGWEKLFSERMCRHFREDFGLQTWVARLHNIYGPLGTYQGGREKAPAAICRKVAEAKLSGDHRIEIWGDGEQSRSFCYVDDCTDGMVRLTGSDFHGPVNLGSSELVTINQLVGIVEDIAGVTLERSYLLNAPKGVRGRNSDNTLIQEKLGWEPSITLREGLEKTYAWILEELS